MNQQNYLIYILLFLLDYVKINFKKSKIKQFLMKQSFIHDNWYIWWNRFCTALIKKVGIIIRENI